MDKLRVLSTILIVSFLAGSAYGADGAVAASHLVTGPSSHVELTNTGTQPVTAWTLVVTTNESDGRVHRAINTVDAYLSEVTREVANSSDKLDRLMPGERREIALDPVAPGSAAEVIAVIYEDGSSAGDKDTIQSIFEQRSRQRDELHEVVLVFESVLPMLKGQAALEELKRKFAAAVTPESTTHRAAREAIDAYLRRETPAAADAIDQLVRKYADIVRREYDLAERHSRPKT